jgi:hypothetical protein
MLYTRLTVQQLEEGHSKSITAYIAKDQLVTYAEGALADYLEQESAELQAAAAAWRRPSTGSTTAAAAAAAAAAERRRSSSSSSSGELSGATSSGSIPGLADAAMDCRWQDVQTAAAASSSDSAQQQTQRTLLYYFSDAHPVLLACHRLRWLMLTWNAHNRNDGAAIRHLGEQHC